MAGNRGRQRLRPAAIAVCLVALSLILSSCSGVSPKLAGGTPSSSTTTTSSTTTSTTLPKPTIKPADLYFTDGETLAVARRTLPIASYRFTAIEALFLGPSTTERASGLGTAIPVGARAAGLSFNGSLAYLDVSPAFLETASVVNFRARLAQVVYTLTAIPGITTVQFYLYGSPLPDIDGIATSGPLTRGDLASAITNYLIETPAVSSEVAQNLTIAGISELAGTMEVQLAVSSGQVILSSEETTTPGETFSFSFPLARTSTGTSTLRVYATPALSQSEQLVVTIPLRLVS